METYSASEFCACYQLRGYGTRREAERWLKRSGVVSPTEADFERCYRENRSRDVMGSEHRCTGRMADGQNLSAPQNATNSYEPDYSDELRKAYYALDKQALKMKGRIT